VIDASLRTRALRDTARRLAHQHDVPFVLVECMAPREVLRARLAERESKGLHESDARSDLLDEFEKRFEPIDELSPSEHLRLDTSRPQEETRRHLAALFEG